MIVAIETTVIKIGIVVIHIVVVVASSSTVAAGPVLWYAGDSAIPLVNS
jgi:hypothetical protein